LVFNKKIITTKIRDVPADLSAENVSSGFSCVFTCENRFPADFPVDITADCLQERCGRFFPIFGRKFRRKISCGFQNPQETITYEGFSWEPKSAGNVFPADFWSKTAGKSAGNK
jgi:hypothetical protein